MSKNLQPVRATQIALAVSALLLTQSALAQDFIQGGNETFTLNVGGIVNQFGTGVSLNGDTQRGQRIDLEGKGLSDSDTSWSVSGTWRIADNHRLSGLFFSAKRSGNRSSDRSFNVGDYVLDASAALNVESKGDFLLLDYRYSFVKQQAFEVAAGFGFYGGNFDFDISGTGTINGNPQTTGEFTSSSSTAVPLPVIGLSGDWYLQPRWKVSSAVMGMAANIGDVDGSVVIFQLGTDYMLTRNWGIGASYMYSKLDVDVTKSGFNGSIDWRTNSIMLYGVAKF